MNRLLQGFKDLFFAIIGLFFSLVIFLIILPQFASKEEVGFIRYIYSCSNILIIFIHLGTPYVILKYYHIFSKKESYFYNFFLILVTLLASVVVALILYFLNISGWKVFKNFNDIDSTFFILFTAICSSLILIVNNIFIIEKIPQFSSSFSNMISRFGLMITVLFFGYNVINTRQLTYGLVISQYLTLFIITYLLVKKTTFKISIGFNFKTKIIKFNQAIKYAAFAFLSSLGGKITAFIDEIMVASILGFSHSGPYGIGLLLASIIYIPFMSIAKLLNPKINKLLINNDLVNLKAIYTQSSTLGLFIGFNLYAILLFTSELLFKIIPNGQIYYSSIQTLTILGVGQIINMGFGLNSDIISFSRYYKHNLYSILLLSAATIFSNIIFIDIWGVTGAAISTVIVTILFNLYKYYIIKLKFNVTPFSKQTLLIILSFIMPFTISYYINLVNHWYLFITKGLSFLILSLTFQYLAGSLKIILKKPAN